MHRKSLSLYAQMRERNQLVTPQEQMLSAMRFPELTPNFLIHSILMTQYKNMMH